MKKIPCLMLLFITLTVLSGCVSTSWEVGRNDFKIVDDRLHRRDSDFTMRAIYMPELCSKGAGLEHMVSAMARVAEVGGNTVAFDLCGFDANGLELAPAAVETVSTYAERARDQGMALLVRLPGSNNTAEFGVNAVETAARALAHEAQAVYWLEGPDANELAARFKRIAPQLVLAAPEHGDLTLASEPSIAGDNGLALLTGALPYDPHGNVSFVLPDVRESYSLMEEAYTTQAERTAWSPDNSLLSDEEREDGFVALFNGRDLDNWWSYRHGEESFHINEEGYIEWYQGGAGAIMTRERYDNFVLRLEYMVSETDANSGIFLRAPRAARQSRIGFEFQIMGDSHLIEPGNQSTAAVYDVLPALTVAARPEGEWNEVEIMLDGPRYRATLNGVLVQDVNFDEIEEMRYRLRRGFIGLQDHGDYVVFRNIRLKQL